MEQKRQLEQKLLRNAYIQNISDGLHNLYMAVVGGELCVSYFVF